MTRKSKKIKYCIGDVIAIPLSNGYVFARILNDCDLAVYEGITHSLEMPHDLPSRPIILYSAFVNSEIISGQWQIIGHVTAATADDDWAPPRYMPDLLTPDRHRIYYRGEILRATETEVCGLERNYMRFPKEVISEIERRLGLPPSHESKTPIVSIEQRMPETAPFANDDAAGWLAELEGVAAWTPVREALAKVADAVGYVEAPECKMAVAAAELVAGGLGCPYALLPETAQDFVDEAGRPTGDLVDLARTGVARIMRDSELRELWEESQLFQQWMAIMQDLLKRLSVEGT